jgi:hypothetical protein
MILTWQNEGTMAEFPADGIPAAGFPMAGLAYDMYRSEKNQNFRRA